MEKVALGIDIGGTNTKYGFVDAQGKIYGETSIPTVLKVGEEQESFEQYIARLCSQAQQTLKECGQDLQPPRSSPNTWAYWLP